MKYRHSHHAGNFADVLKHLTLIDVLNALGKKDTPLCYIDTHAGRGRYSLELANPAAHGEYRGGFGRLRAAPNVESPAIVEYVSTIKRLTDDIDGLPRSYPGSPLIAATLLRDADRAVLFELTQHEASVLKENLYPYPNIHIHQADGYAGLRAQVPPRERRGMVLIDPAYEAQEQEFVALMKTVRDAYSRWPTGTYAMWYPIKRRAAVERFHDELRASGIRRILSAELCLFPDDSGVSLNGSGMAIVNPPWQTDQRLAGALPELHRLLGGVPNTVAECRWIVPE
jgi:23S rRNA (adenine2030-N6)-methyltransferase